MAPPPGRLDFQGAGPRLVRAVERCSTRSHRQRPAADVRRRPSLGSAEPARLGGTCPRSSARSGPPTNSWSSGPWTYLATHPRRAFESVMARIRVPRSGPGRPRTRPDAVLADRAYSSRAIRNHLRRRGIGAVIPRPSDRIGHRLRGGRAGGRPPAGFRRRGVQAAQRGRAMHQPAQAVARPGCANGQARHRLPGRTPPCRHPDPGTATAPFSDRPPNARPQARILCQRCAPRA